MKDKYLEYKTLPAYIINKNINNYEKTLVINVGSKSGIEKNMTVIAAEGLVGHVISVTDETAKVQTIIDSSSNTSSILSSSRDSVVCKGQLEEHHKIRNSIIQSEADMWNY